MNAPLTDREYAEIRSAVMAEIQRPPRRPHGAFVPAFACAALVVLVVSVFVARRPLTRPSATLSPRGGERAHTVATPQVVQVVLRPAQPGEGPRPIRHHHHHHPKPVVQLAAVRMDIQTSDPNVRIIWFAR
jgi:hypothetical protein